MSYGGFEYGGGGGGGGFGGGMNGELNKNLLYVGRGASVLLSDLGE